MSVNAKRRISVKNESKKCAARFWRFVPHLLLCSSLVAYAALGALIFQHIEGQKPSAIQQEYDNFLRQMVGTVESLRDNGTSTEGLVEEVRTMMQDDFKSIYFQRHDRWDFFGSMFFCCTVFTTVGYGEIYPVTNLGKVACVFYAMVGIPLMLLVILDVGDFLAMMMSRAYIHVHTFFKKLCSRIWSPWKVQSRDSRHQTLEDGTFVFSHDVVIREPLSIQQVLHSQADVRHKSIQLQNNKEIFEKILARENLLRKGPLLRSFSCPELDRLPSFSKYALWDFTGLGDEMETLNVPLLLIIFIVFAYICFGGSILQLWERFKDPFDPYYFCFITLTTIGFGDIIPTHPKFFMLISLFIIVGMAIMSMAFKLSQTRIVSCYRQCVKFISRGNVETFKNDKKD